MALHRAMSFNSFPNFQGFGLCVCESESPTSTDSVDVPVLPLQLHGSTANGCEILRCSGKLIAETADFFKSEAIRQIDRGTVVAVDLTGLTDMDGSGLRALFSVFSSAQKAQCEFRVLNGTPRVADLLDLTSLANV
jgi:anti-anti-sigma factor